VIESTRQRQVSSEAVEQLWANCHSPIFELIFKLQFHSLSVAIIYCKLKNFFQVPLSESGTLLFA